MNAVTEIAPLVGIVAACTTLGAYYAFVERLRSLGFEACTDEGAPLCRLVVSGIRVDVMGAADTALGPTNRWYAEAIAAAEPHSVASDLEVLAISPIYFAATKLEAFHSRGGGDYVESHDLEDVLTVFAGLPSLRAEVEAGAPASHVTFVMTSRASRRKRRSSRPSGVTSKETRPAMLARRPSARGCGSVPERVPPQPRERASSVDQARASSWRGTRVRRPEHEHRDVVASKVACAVHLGQYHRAELPAADHDVDGRTADRRKPAFREELHDRWHLCPNRRGAVGADHALVVFDREQPVRVRALPDAHFVEEAAAEGNPLLRGRRDLRHDTVGERRLTDQEKSAVSCHFVRPRADEARIERELLAPSLGEQHERSGAPGGRRRTAHRLP